MLFRSGKEPQEPEASASFGKEPLRELRSAKKTEPVERIEDAENIEDAGIRTESTGNEEARKELDAWDGTVTSKEASEKISAEQAIQNYRNMLLERKNDTPPKKMNLLLYTSATAAMVILCVIGITTMNNYEKMRQVEQTLSVMSGQAETKQDKEGDKAKDTKSDGLVVESIPGEVTPETEAGQTQPENDASGQKEAAGSQDQPTGSQGEGAAGANGPSTGQTEGAAGQTTGSGQPAGGEGQGSGSQGNQGSGGGEGQDSGSQDGAASGNQEEQAQETGAQVYLDQGYYIVQEGDKLELICKKIYNTTAMLEQLCAANQITDVDKIYAGQKLVLP